MVTPFGAFINLELPKLSDVYAYQATFRGLDEQCGRAFGELERMLCHGRIQRLHYLSMGQAAVEVLQDEMSSCAAFWSLIYAVGAHGAHHEFDSHHSLPYLAGMGVREQVDEDIRLKKEGWDDRRKNYQQWHSELFDWKWSDRDLDLGHTGTVQAVITARLKKKI